MKDGDTADGQPPKYELGVLVVHGIGDQKQGATLTTWVDSIADWMVKRGGKATVRRAELHPPDGPANVELHVEGPPRVGAKTGKEQDWLFAEGWWASTFEPPSFGELWGWSFVSVPATAAMHANTVVRTAVRRLRSANGPQRIVEAFRLLLMLFLLVVLVMISPLILVLLTLLLVLGLVASVLPIAALRTAILKAQLISIGTIGDTKRLIDSPTHTGAIKSPVIDGIRYLHEERCEKIVVLAHSQGAAVTHKALVDVGEGLHDELRLPKLASFISIGSGLPKVHQLQFLSSEKGKGLRLAALLVPASAVATALSIRYLVNEGSLEGLAAMGITAAGVAILTAVYGAYGGHVERKAAEEADQRNASAVEAARLARSRKVKVQKYMAWAGVALAFLVALPFDNSLVTFAAAASILVALRSLVELAIREIPKIDETLVDSTERWMDIWASGDPVPAGPTETRMKGRPESWRVTNLASVVRDHNAYPGNDDECLSFIGSELCHISHLLSGVVRDQIRLEQNERRWRVGWRSFVGYAMAGAAIVFAWTTWRGADEALRRWYRRLMEPDGLADTWYPGDLSSAIPTTMSAGVAQVLTVIGYVVIGLVAVEVGNAAWSAWNKAAAEAELNRQRLEATAEATKDKLRSGTIPLKLRDAIARLSASSSDKADGKFTAMIGLVVFTWFVAIVPQFVWDSWLALDLTSWTGVGLLVGAVGAAMAVGALVPWLIDLTPLRRADAGRDRSRIEGLVAYADFQLKHTEKNPLGHARRTIDAAVTMADNSGHIHPDALAAKARVMLIEAAQLREQVRAAEARQDADSPDVAMTTAQLAFKASDNEHQALDLYRRATSRRGLPTPRIRLEYARQLYRLGGDRYALEINRQLRDAGARDENDLDIIVAIVAHRPHDGGRDPVWIGRLEEQLALVRPLVPRRVEPLFTLIAASGPDHPSRDERTAELLDLVARGVVDPDFNPGPTLELLEADGWPDADRSELGQLANASTGRVRLDADEAHSPPDRREQPTNA